MLILLKLPMAYRLERALTLVHQVQVISQRRVLISTLLQASTPILGRYIIEGASTSMPWNIIRWHYQNLIKRYHPKGQRTNPNLTRSKLTSRLFSILLALFTARKERLTVTERRRYLATSNLSRFVKQSLERNTLKPWQLIIILDLCTSI